jgi:aspartate ammonia-lyase
MSSEDVWRVNPNMLVPYYLMHSYIYYEINDSIITDYEYDEICKELKDKWDDVKHYHKHLVDVTALGAGTGYQLKYNKRIENAAIMLYNKHHGLPSPLDMLNEKGDSIWQQ